MLTNVGLVNHAKRALNEKWGYVWGTFGMILTEQLLNSKLKQYPIEVGAYIDFIRNNWVNKPTVDCIGLIKSYLWMDNALGSIIYNSKTDVSTQDMFAMAEEKGKINSLPIRDLPGLLVWKMGHIGVYIGDGQVIEARGTKSGVIQTPLKGVGATDWTHWLKCPFIKYEQKTIKDYKQLIQENASNVEDWIRGIDTAVAAAKADGNLGALEIFQHLPLLLEKIGNK